MKEIEEVEIANKFKQTTGYYPSEKPFDATYFRAGYLAAQKKLLEKCSENFNEWAVETFNIAPDLVNEFKFTFRHRLQFTENAWQASRISLLAENEQQLSALRERLKEAEEVIGFYAQGSYHDDRSPVEHESKISVSGLTRKDPSGVFTQTVQINELGKRAREYLKKHEGEE